MRILALTNLYPSPLLPHRAPYNRQQFRILSEMHPLRVIAPVLWTDEWAAYRQALPSLPAGRRVVHDGLTVDHPRYWYPPKILRGLYGRCFLASVRATFERVVREFNPEVIFAPWAYPDGYAAVQLAKSVGLPAVVQVHGSDIRELTRYRGRASGTATAVREADGVIAVSSDLAEKVIALGATRRRVQVVIDGVDRRAFCPGSKSEARQRLHFSSGTKHLLFVGSLVPVKGLDVLLAACRQLAAAVGPWQLHLVGDGPQRRRLAQLAASYGLESQVVFHGSVPHADLPDWFRAADVFVLPSRSEGVPNVLLEAAACGVPFVASAVGGIPEIAGLGASRLVPPEQPLPLAEALAAMLQAPPPPGPGPRDRRDAVSEIAVFLQRFAAMRGEPELLTASPLTYSSTRC
ncbi:MAG: glycosyltransferase [Pirellulaceae bacterium]